MKPGFLSTADARDASRFVRQAEANRRTLERRRRPWRERFPAELTAYDSTTGGFSFREQWYTSAAGRAEKPGGRTGTGTAFPFGDGSAPVALPREVTLYRRLVASTGSIAGQVAYEFPWYCACEGGSAAFDLDVDEGSGGSGAGSGSGERIGSITCCPGLTLPLTIFCTPDGGFGTFPMVWDAPRDQWYGCGHAGFVNPPFDMTPRWLAIGFKRNCSLPYACSAGASSAVCVGPAGIVAAGGSASIVCSPFSVTFSTAGGGFTGCPTAPRNITGVISE